MAFKSGLVSANCASNNSTQIAIYPVNNVIQPLNNQALSDNYQ